MKSIATFFRWLLAAVAALFAPALAAFASAFLYFSLYGVRADPFFVLQLYAGFFIVLNLMIAPALARGHGRNKNGSEGDVALVALIASAAGIGLLLSVRAVFPPWPPSPLMRDLLFVGGASLIAMISFWLSALFS
jgi:hypothetical protein